MTKLILEFFILFIPLLLEAKPIRILFIGNSYTFEPGTPNEPELPRQFTLIANELGKTINVESIVKPGYTLKKHLEESFIFDRLKNGHFDFVIIQSHSLDPLILPICFPNNGYPQGRSQFIEAGAQIAGYAYSVGTTPVLFVHWTYQKNNEKLNDNFNCLRFKDNEINPRQKWYGENLETYQAMLNQGFALIASQVPTAITSLIGNKWRQALTDPKTPISDTDLYQPDHTHPTAIGTFFNAMILTRDVLSADLNELKSYPKELSEAKFQFLKAQLKNTY
jgi:hypothetical protein